MFFQAIASFGLFLTAVSAGNLKGSFDMTAGNLAITHSQNAYCGTPDTYMTRTYFGDLEGFTPTYHINSAHDTQGYVGYSESQATIYVVFRGSESMSNWISNIDAVLTDYPLCSGCSVHKGFYDAQKGASADVRSQVKALREKFPSYSLMVTGHSLGAALATLTAADLQDAGLGPVRMFNFGSPRVGDTDFANWFSSYVPDHYRVTHHKDIVVHSPMHERFTHINGEWYEPDNSVPVQLIGCSGNEDKDCSYQWHITSVDDHLWYMGLKIGDDGQC
jgi:hypothetical protein